MIGVSPEFQALVRTDHRHVARVDVLRDGAVIKSLAVHSGSVTADRSGRILRRFEATVSDPTGELTPAGIADLLAPFGTEIRLYRGVTIPVGDSSRDELCPLGVFTLNDTSVSDGPNGLEIELSGADLSRRISRNRWDNTYVVPQASNYAEAIKAVVVDRMPSVLTNFESTGRLTPRLFFGEQESNDPWTDGQDMAVAIGHELYFDPLGIATLRPEPDPDTDAAVWDFNDAAHPTITDLTRRVTDENTYSKIVVTGEGTSLDAPVRAVAIDDNPASPTYYLGPYGTVTLRVTTPMVTTAEQAQDAADALLRRFQGATEAVEIEVVPMPALEPGDVVTVTRGRGKVEGRFLIDALRIPLGAEETMRIVGRRQRL